jgi:hypothetical protein
MNKLTIVAVTLALAAPAQAPARSHLHRVRSRRIKTLSTSASLKRTQNELPAIPVYGEWGWVCEGGGGKLMRVRGEGAKYKNNAVCE